MENNLRPPQFAGSVYNTNPTVLRKDLLSILTEDPLTELPDPTKLRVLKVPHIDYLRGHRTYGHGYQLLNKSNFDVLFLMGTSHSYSNSLFIGTKKKYGSPLGVHQNHESSISILEKVYGERLFLDEVLHDKEHSLELQLPFMTYCLPEVTLVPLLIGSFHHMYRGRHRSTIESYEIFIDGMLESMAALDAKGIRYGFVAGVDMAHVGKFFGDPHSLSKERMEEIKNLDEEYLNHICNLDTDALFHHCVKDGDAQRMCGHSTMVTICDLLQRRGEKLTPFLSGYEQCYSQHNDCLVSIASMGLYT